MWMNAWEFFSKYRGAAEEIVAMLFQRARERQPSVILFDDIDCLFRDPDQPDAETSQNIRSVLVTQIEGKYDV